MRRECRERFLRHRLQMKPLVSYPGVHHGTCHTHVSWCMSESITRGGGENIPGIPGACTNHSFAYLVRGPCMPTILDLFGRKRRSSGAGGDDFILWLPGAFSRCDEVVLNGNNGSIESPSYPDFYGGNQECQWTIHVEDDMVSLSESRLNSKSHVVHI